MILDSVRIALLDLDGTLYRGKTVVPGAAKFVADLRRLEIQPVFFTNNASRTPDQVASHIAHLGIECDATEVCTSAQAAAALVAADVPAGSTVAYVGMDGVREALGAVGLAPLHVRDVDGIDGARDVAATVLGLQFDVTYPDLCVFSQITRELGRFVLTNGDVCFPVERGFWPGNGAVGQLVSATTGIQPVVAGKPEVSFVHHALRRFGHTAAEAVIIGDNLATDVAAGLAAGIRTIHVMTGVGQPASGPEAAEMANDMTTNPLFHRFPSVAEIL